MESLRKKIRQIINEINLNEFTDEEFQILDSQYSNKRIILSNENEIIFKPKDQKQEPTYKPSGLWYGFGASWLDWVRSEMPEWEKDYSKIFVIEINEGSVLKMSTFEELLEFTNKYSPSKNIPIFKMNLIDWSEVAKDYSGIEINPYIFRARMNEKTNWYYTWDVASGCIWDRNAIKSITELKV